MAAIRPLSGVRFDPGRVALEDVLAPPYDVIDPAMRDRLAARDEHNIVRVDLGEDLPGDEPGRRDRYTRAAERLHAWCDEGVLRRDRRPAYYVTTHEFTSVDGARRVRRGVFARLPARPWEQAELLPHERTLSGPKEDRLRLMRATGVQTSAVFAVWDAAPRVDAILDAVCAAAADAEARTDGEQGLEEHRLWVADGAGEVGAITAALGSSRLYVADGHHRYETAAAYAAERRAGEPGAPGDADFTMSLMYLCAADDPAVEVLPTHRLVRPHPGVPGDLATLAERLAGRMSTTPAVSLEAALDQMRARRAGEHCFVALTAGGCAVLAAPRRRGPSPRAGLDVVVLQEEVLERACGLDASAIRGGALDYSRDPGDAQQAVGSGSAALGLLCNGVTAAEIIAVAGEGEVMPQKSTYFHPKVPTGLVLSPL